MGAEYSKEVVETMSRRNPVNGLANQSLQILIDWDGPDLSDWLKALLKQRYHEANAWSTFIQGLPWNRKEDDRLPREYFITKLLLALFKRISPQSLEPTYVTMAGALLGKCSGAVAGQAGLLLYLLSKDEGLRCLQTALSGRVPAAQSEAAAACVIINSDHSKEILVSALKNTETRIQHVAACALSMFPSHDARTLAYAWLEKNVGLKNPQGKELTIGDRTITTYSMEEVMQSNTSIFFSHDLKQLREDFGPFFPTRA